MPTGLQVLRNNNRTTKKKKKAFSLNIFFVLWFVVCIF